jgi:hypothetical protein
MTSPALIEEIARCIELGQSVLLEGPRGCGKSHCVRAAYELAVERGFIPKGAWVPVQGNREIPRDYLAEDDTTFRLRPRSSGTKVEDERRPEYEQPDDGKTEYEVLPIRKNAPLFQFALRYRADGSPVIDKSSEQVICEINGKPCDRFVLFLDEVNRFSDGVLDSLLSVLEERKAVLGGREYKLPVTVGMTMNPPGYDSSARKLSPPLAARIGRSYRLSTPDLSTMCDLIVGGRVRAMQIERRIAARVATPHQTPISINQPDARLLRKAALVTLCLWGDVRRFDAGSEGDDQLDSVSAGLEYLTESSRALVRACIERDPQVEASLMQLSNLCRYGPDGRAIADWTTSAIAASVADAALYKHDQATAMSEHYIATAVRTLSHKLFDSFSSATRPDQTRLKESIVDTVASRILTSSIFDDLVDRDIDNRSIVRSQIADHLFQHSSQNDTACSAKDDLCIDLVTLAFIKARVTEDEDVQFWMRSLSSSDPMDKALGVASNRMDVPLFTVESVAGLAAFFEPNHDLLAKHLAELSMVMACLDSIATLVRKWRDPLLQGVGDDESTAVGVIIRRHLSRCDVNDHVGKRLYRVTEAIQSSEEIEEEERLRLGKVASSAFDPKRIGWAREAIDDWLDRLVETFGSNPGDVPDQVLEACGNIPRLTDRAQAISELVTAKLGPVRERLELRVGSSEIARMIGVSKVISIIKGDGTDRSDMHVIDIVQHLDTIYTLCHGDHAAAPRDRRAIRRHRNSIARLMADDRATRTLYEDTIKAVQLHGDPRMLDRALTLEQVLQPDKRRARKKKVQQFWSS